jgi:molybdopterin synthase catalytic subunit
MAKNKTKITEKDFGMNAIIRNLEDLKGKGVKVGLQGTSGNKKHDKSKTETVVDIATKHEFGTNRIPERSFLRATYNIQRQNWLKYNNEIINKLVVQKTPLSPLKVFLGLIGERMQKDIKKFIRSGVNPPNTPSTLKNKLRLTRKGSEKTPKPLIDTGQMLNSIHWVTKGKK